MTRRGRLSAGAGPEVVVQGGPLAQIEFANSTDLSDGALLAMCGEAAAEWSVGRIYLRVRYSRGADFSGTCFYGERRIHVNLGRHLTYPYLMGTHLARSKTLGQYWYKPVYTLRLKDGYRVVLFVFMHELYHLLVRKARRNTRQKESMCDRFAARYLVEHYGARVHDRRGRPVPREAWDFQDVEGFVAPARRRRPRRSLAATTVPRDKGHDGAQLLLFPI